jgi:hypothetical protein
MNKIDLEKELQSLRLKWKVFPKSHLDKDWCQFRVDKSKALYLIEQIKKIDSGLLTSEQMEELLK